MNYINNWLNTDSMLGMFFSGMGFTALSRLFIYLELMRKAEVGKNKFSGKILLTFHKLNLAFSHVCR